MNNFSEVLKLFKRSVLFIALILLLVFAPIFHGQTKREVLTNAKIIELVRLGLDEEIIIEKIRQSDCQCDTTTEALAKLKGAKVSNAIIKAMLNSSSNSYGESSQNSNQTSNEENAASKTVSTNSSLVSAGQKALNQISEPGIYLFENGEMKQIEPSVFSGGKINPLMGTLTYGIKKTSYRTKVRGKSANMQIPNTLPEFYFVFNPEYKNSGATMAGLFWGMPATSPAEFILIQMNVKENSREAILGEYGAWTGASMGARDKDIREYSFEKIKPGIYKVVPKAALTRGEYCFYYAGNVVGLGFAGGKVFDFSISSKI